MSRKPQRVGLVATVLLFAMVATAPAAAGDVAVGVNLSLTLGAFDFELEPDLPPNIDGDADAFFTGVGFMLDTAVSGDAVFGYRLNAGFEVAGADVDYDLGGSDDLGLFGFVLDNDFGFRVYSNEKVRLWIGPTVRFGLFAGEFDDDAELFDDNDDEVDLKAAVFGVGPILGANINMGKRFALSVAGGVRADFYSGEAEDDLDNNIDFEADGPAPFVRVGFLVRLP